MSDRVEKPGRTDFRAIPRYIDNRMTQSIVKSPIGIPCVLMALAEAHRWGRKRDYAAKGRAPIAVSFGRIDFDFGLVASVGRGPTGAASSATGTRSHRERARYTYF
jgi:hypothetical protein